MSDLTEKIARLSPKRLALLALELQSKLDAIDGERRESIAIVGIGCRFPGGVTDPESFWTLLRNGVDAVTEVPPERWDVDAYYDPDPEAPAKTYSRHGAFLKDIDRFDPHFFGIAPREALRMDPQQRLILEVAWEALERAGIAPASLVESRTGVFLGISGHDYADLLARAGSTYLDAHFLTGNPLNFAAGRLSYSLGLQGPSMAVDTACSSSLVAVHLACQSLRAKECQMALAAGVNLVLVAEANVVLAKAHMLAVDGRCKTFDAAADGYVRGEGCGVVVLKRLSDAVANGDQILAVIRGSATNQDGPSSGLTVPNGPAQQTLIREALGVGGIRPADVSYIEAHGTGTSLGDPIEVQALAGALGDGRSADNPLLIGSVKTNVGHLEAAAGIAGLIKVVLALQHKTIPPHLHLKTVNPNISLSAIPAAIPTVSTAWEPRAGRRIAGVSSFGASGTNAHVVLEEAPDPRTTPNVVDRPRHVLALSAKTADALDDLRAQYARRLESDADSLADLCFTANTGRSHFAHRLGVTGSDSREVAARLKLTGGSDGRHRGQVTSVDRVKIAFVFPDEGFDVDRATHAIYDSQPTFRQAVDQCREGLQIAGVDDASPVARLFVFEYAIAALWRAWGVEPAGVAGFGAGEYAASCVAGACSLRDAIALVAAHSRSAQDAGAAKARFAFRRPNIAVAIGTDAVETLAGQGFSRFVTMGPGATGARPETELWLASTTDLGDTWTALIDSIAALYVNGAPVDWAAFDRDFDRRKLTLPTYPFRRQRFWPDLVPSAGPNAAEPGRMLLGSRLRTALSDKIYQCRLSADAPAFLGDHRVQGAVVFPATGYVAIAHAAARESWPVDSPVVEDLVIHSALIVPAGGRTIQTTVASVDADTFSFRVLSSDDRGNDDEWRAHASGTVRRARADDPLAPTQPLQTVQARCATDVSVGDYYDRLSAGGLEFGAAFRGVVQLRAGHDEAIGEVRLPETLAGDRDAYLLHPAMLDACFQVLGAARGQSDGGDSYLPLGIARMRVLRPAGTRIFAHARLLSGDQASRETITADLTLYDEQGVAVGLVEGLQLNRASVTREVSSRDVADSLYEIQWELSPPSSERTAAAQGAWVILEDDTGVAGEIARRFEASGRRVVLVRPGEAYRRQADGRTFVDPGRASDFVQLREQIAAEGNKVAGIVHLWSLNRHESSTPADVMNAERTLCASTLHAAQVLAREDVAGRLIVVTRGAQSVDAALAVDPVQAPVWGLCRAVASEFPELPCIRIDLDPATAADIDTLVAAIDGDSREDQIALRGHSRYVPRLARSATAQAGDPIDADRPVRLSIDERGVLENLRLIAVERRAPGPGEIEIRVQTTGLNFRDVLNALGMYPGDPGPIGNECVGTIVRVGEGVKGLAQGQTVMALGAGTFATYVTTAADLAGPIPGNLNAAEAATIPITFLTAEYALNRLAGMKAGDRVLIHAAAGGVGLAALQLAQRAGAEIFATAGSPEKRALLKSLGVAHVMDSRSLAFADEIKAITNGEGIDIVLNSLAGEFIPKSLGTLRANGRFLEIGKTGIWNASAVAEVRPDISYHAIYLGEVAPPEIQAMLRRLATDFESGALKPLPLQEFPLDRAVDAFRFMAQARHIGKLVISQASKAFAIAGDWSLRDDRTYLITGGYGGLGLAVTRWMIDRGARHLVLVGRRGPSTETSGIISTLCAGGADVRIRQADISSARDVAALLADIGGTMPDLGGIVHAAGVLDDGALMQQTWERFERVLGPKVAGAWNLHEQTKHLPLDFFVMFSSVTSLLGNPGQANYAAANAFLDAMACERRAKGLPALTINWGPWAGSGMAATLDSGSPSRWSALGISPFLAEQGLAALERALTLRSTHVAAIRINWRTFMQAFKPGTEPPLLSGFASARGAVAPQAAPSAFTAPELTVALTGVRSADRLRIVHEYVADQARKVLGLEASFAFQPHQGLRDVGLDSLMSVELRNRLQRGSGLSLPATLAFDFPTVEALTSRLLEKLDEAAEPASPEMPHAVPATAAGQAAVTNEAIAVVGLGCRFPGGASSPDAFWQQLSRGFDGTSEIPSDRWDVDAYYDADPDAPGKMYTRRGAFLDRVDLFDPQFFGIAPREAISLDPQQRLLLEVSWEALEHAGEAPDRLFGSKTGVFIGISTNEYGLLQRDAASAPDVYAGTGNALSAAAGRLSYVLGFQGPCLSVDTACSSSLVAVHLACQALRARECAMALAGGVNVMLVPEVTVNFCRARMMSADGRCKTFDAAADGYVRGEGCGVVVLKRLSDAVAAGDTILAVIAGSGSNQDGRSSGLTVPNGPAQEALLRDVYASAGIAPGDVDYVEAHGTGTSLGDPIEVQALGHVLGAGRAATKPLLLGSVKTNIGHLEAAAGVSGLIKVVLALQHEEIPPHLNFNSPNPNIPWSDLPIEVTTAKRSWPAGSRRIASVSSFGFTGTNAHIILESAPVVEVGERPADRPLHLLALSAKSPDALKELALRYSRSIDAHADIADVCYTANAGRAHFDHRLAVHASSNADLRDSLSVFAKGGQPEGLRSGRAAGGIAPRVAFEIMSGEVSPHFDELYATQPTFRQAFDESADVSKALIALWRSWGIADALIVTSRAEAEAAGCRLVVPVGPDQASWTSLLRTAADLYVAGAAIRWEAFDREYARRKANLPTYPFQRQRYWLELRSGARLPKRVPAMSEAPATDGVTYEIRWEKQDASTAIVDQQSAGTWLILADAAGVGRSLAEQLGARGDHAVVVQSQLETEGFATIVQRAAAESSAPLKGVVHLLNLDAAPADQTTMETLAHDQAAGCVSILRLTQALVSCGSSARLWIVTSGAQTTTGDTTRPAQIAQSPAWGFGRVVALEHPEVWGGLIDLDRIDLEESASQIVRTLTDPALENQVAFRNGARYVPRLVRSEDPPAGRRQLASAGTYLITGGLGSLGLKTAEWLAERGAGAVVLLGRRTLPPKELWSGFDADHPARAQIDMIRRIEHHGTQVRVVQADVCDIGRMREVFDDLHRLDPPLKGIVHAAGISTPRALESLDDDGLVRELAPKTIGTWILHELSRDIPIDFFVSYSSIASVWGSTGLAHYAAANHFLDTLAHYRRAMGLPALTINWGRLWLRGMITAGGAQWLEATGVNALSEADAVAAFEQLLSSESAQTTVARIDWSTFKPLYEAHGRKPFLDLIAASDDKGGATGRLMSELGAADPADRARILESALGQWVARILGLPFSAVSDGTPLSKLGLDSLMALELRNRIQTETGVTLPLVSIVEGPSVAELAVIVFDKLKESFGGERVVRATDASPERVLDRLDDLSDENVDELLRQLLSEK